MKAQIDFADVQGLVRFGFGRMEEAAYALLRVKDTAAAQAWLASAEVTTAVAQDPPPKTALQIAFTAPGLRALGLPEEVIAGFSHEFRGGMAEESRARQLGDVGSNAPENWTWGSATHEPHLMVMLFAEQKQLAAFRDKSTRGWSVAFEEPRWLPTENLDDKEPFGFKDGISQPQVDWEHTRPTPCTQLDYTNLVAPGEFLLGYRNEYGKITDRPLLASDETTADLLPATDAPGRKDLGVNGTYLVMRQLEQDVRKFWQFAHAQAEGDAAKAEQLATAMVGRHRDGTPLVPIQDEAIAGIDEENAKKNRFTFDSDPAGVRCPFGAHIRRANPRIPDYPGRPGFFAKLRTLLGFGPGGFRDDLMSSVRFHRILRRGREYGKELLPAEALSPAPPNDPPRGLYFICLNANILRQFEFLQNAWMMSTKFSGLTDESDPLLGHRQPIPGCPVTGNFTLPVDGSLRKRVAGLPPFVTVRGGAYFFLPSLRALRYLAGRRL